MSDGPAATSVSGRLVLDDRVAAGRITIEDGRIAAVDLDDGRCPRSRAAHRAGLRRRPCPRLGRPRRDGRPRRPRRDGPGAAPSRRHVLPADRRLRAPPRAGRLRRARPRVAARRPGRRRRAAGLEPRGAIPRRSEARRPRPRGAPRSERSSQDRPRAAPRRATAHHHRPGAPRRTGPHRLVPRSRGDGLARPFGGDARGGESGLRGRRDRHDPPVQRDDGARPPGTRARARGPARRARLRRAHRRWHPRPSRGCGG